MERDGHEGGGTIGGKLGCLASVLVALPLLGFLLFLSVYGNCGKGDPCNRGEGVRFWLLIGAVAVVAIGSGLAVRSLANHLAQRHRK